VESGVLRTFYIHEHLIKYRSSTANIIAVTEVLKSSFHCCWQRIFNDKTNSFQICRFVFPQLYMYMF